MDYQIIEHWLKNLNYKKLSEKIGKKEVAIWGAYSGGKEVEKFLEKNHIPVAYYIDAHKEQLFYQNKPVIHPTKIREKNLFILVAVVGVRTEIIDYLSSSFLNENIDYIYISKNIPQITIFRCSGSYADQNGNLIEFADNEIKCRITMIGYNNHVIIGKGFSAKKKTEIVVENGSCIMIGNNVHLGKFVQLEALNGGKLNMGDCCLIYKNSRICSKGADIILGNYVTAGERFLCLNGKTASITVGNDCMFANDVTLLASSGHSIFDLKKETNISIKKEKFIKLGKHVWLGKNVTVLYNAEIGDGCIVGANSLVKLKTDANCIIAGNPAKVIKEFYTWDRRMDIAFTDR